MNPRESASILAGGTAAAMKATGGHLVPYPHQGLLFGQLGRVMAGEIDRLMICMPPRHGKSLSVSGAVATWLVVDQRMQFGLATYGRDLSKDLSRQIRRFYTSLGGEHAEVAEVTRWDTARGGGMWAQGTGGAILGRGGDVLVGDDILRGADAMSATERERAWDWYTGTFRNRLAPEGSIILIGTRWHDDDILGRVLALEEQVTEFEREGWVVLLVDMEYDPETLAELRRKLPDNEIIGLEREIGERLTRYSEAEIDRDKATAGSYYWSALYQQRPVARTGAMFSRHHFGVVDAVPDAELMVRAWDLAVTKGAKADQTVGALMAMTGADDRRSWCVLDVEHGRWTPAERLEVVVGTALRDGPLVTQLFEEERGGAGKAVTHQLIRAVAPCPGEAIRPTGEKQVRAEPLAAQVEGGNVTLLRGPWNKPFLDELSSFPRGRHDDFTDATAHAFNWLASQDAPSSWLDML